MTWLFASLLALLALSTPAFADGQETATDALCVLNGSGNSHLFVAEAAGAGCMVAELGPGERLCVEGADSAARGVVSVFEDADAFEGCSRLVPVGRTEVMRKYVDFDRCFWSSNS